MRIIIILIAFSFVGCATQAQTAKEFAFDNWVHHTDEKYDVELVYSNQNPNKTSSRLSTSHFARAFNRSDINEEKGDLKKMKGRKT